jgi:hypothetical protein
MIVSHFEKVVSSYGGRLDDKAHETLNQYTVMRGYAQRRIQQLIQSTSVPRQHRKVFVDFINSGEVNALTFLGPDKQTYCIAITAGVLMGLSNLFAQMFRTRSFCPTIGKPAGEWRPRDIVVGRRGALIYSPNDLAITPEGWVTPKLPNTRTRRLCYRLCLIMAWDFLIAHEVGHILLGHVDDALGANKQVLLAESTSSLPVEVTPNVSHLRELTADKFAFTLILQDWYRTGTWAQLKGLLPNRYSRLPLRCWVIAITTLIYVFGKPWNSVTLHDNLTHPHPDVRLCRTMLQLMYLMAIKELQNQQVFLLEKMWPTLRNDVEETRQFLLKVDVEANDRTAPNFWDENYAIELVGRASVASSS